MKKLFCALLALVVLMSAMVVFVQAETAPVFILTADKKTAAPGENVTFTISGKNLADTAGVQLYILFDEAVFAPVTAEESDGTVYTGKSLIDAGSGWDTAMSVSRKQGKLIFLAYRNFDEAPELNENLDMYSFELTVKEDAAEIQTPVSMFAEKICDSAAAEISCEISGNVTVTVKKPIPPHKTFEYRLLEDGTAAITRYAPETFQSEVEVPGEVDGYSVTTVDAGAFKDADGVLKLNLPASLNLIYPGVFDDLADLKEISVSPDNTVYKSVSGLLYTADDRMLVRCPRAFEGELILPDGLAKIGYWAFGKCGKITGVTVPRSVGSIGADSFAFSSSLNPVIYGYTDTVAEVYAVQSGLTFVALDAPEKGDVDKNKMIDVNDIAALKKLIADGDQSKVNLALGDLDNSGMLDVNDITALKTLIITA